MKRLRCCRTVATDKCYLLTMHTLSRGKTAVPCAHCTANAPSVSKQSHKNTASPRWLVNISCARSVSEHEVDRSRMHAPRHTALAGQPASRSTRGRRSASQNVHQPASRPASRSASQQIYQPAGQPASRSASRQVHQPAGLTTASRSASKHCHHQPASLPASTSASRSTSWQMYK